MSNGISVEFIKNELKNKVFRPQKIVQFKEKDTGRGIPVFIFVCLNRELIFYLTNGYFKKY